MDRSNSRHPRQHTTSPFLPYRGIQATGQIPSALRLGSARRVLPYRSSSFRCLPLRQLASLAWLATATTSLAFGQRIDDGTAPATDTQTLAVRRVLDEQAKAWNNGDLEHFMAHYWNSDHLTFSSGGKTTRGWQQTRERYLRRYPDRTAMGELSFDNLEVYSLGSDACFVLGRWTLDRASDHPTGNFTLVMRQMGDRWLIVHDHTSVLEEEH